MVILALLYGCKTWIIRNKDRGKIETVDMKFLKGVIGCRHLDHVRSVAVREGSAIKRSLNTIVSRLPVQQVINNCFDMSVAIYSKHQLNVHTAQRQMTLSNLGQVYTNNAKDHESFHSKN